MAEQKTIHATCVALDNCGVLLRGRPGAGKSDLALRLIESGGILVSDDQVVITCQNNQLLASPPAQLEGMLEVRGVGICHYTFLPQCNVYVVIDLDQGSLPERHPDLESQKQQILNVSIARFVLDPFQASAPAKVRAMLKSLNL